jgi:RimJ/RimL family protein N-acetyltransferase
MSTRRIRLRIITEQDSAFLYEMMTSVQSGGRVRFAGATPSPEKIASSLWEGVLAQFIIEGVNTQKPFGLVAVTSPNFRDGFAYISALGPAQTQGLGMIAEGVLLGFHYAFSTWPFRKIYMEATEESYRAFKSGVGRFFVEEARLKEHIFWNGNFMDLLILAVYRETWARHAAPMLKRLHASS